MAKATEELEDRGYESVWEVIGQLDDSGADEYDVALKVLRTVDEEALIDVIVDLVRKYRRHQARYAEEAAMDIADFPLPAGRRSRTPQDPIAEFLTARFFVPDVGYITWADATIAHHQARAKYQHKQAEGFERDAARHEEAIKLIRKHKVTCLKQVPKGQLRAAL